MNICPNADNCKEDCMHKIPHNPHSGCPDPGCPDPCDRFSPDGSRKGIPGSRCAPIKSLCDHADTTAVKWTADSFKETAIRINKDITSGFKVICDHANDCGNSLCPHRKNHECGKSCVAMTSCSVAKERICVVTQEKKLHQCNLANHCPEYSCTHRTAHEHTGNCIPEYINDSCIIPIAIVGALAAVVSRACLPSRITDSPMPKPTSKFLFCNAANCQNTTCSHKSPHKHQDGCSLGCSIEKGIAKSRCEPFDPRMRYLAASDRLDSLHWQLRTLDGEIEQVINAIRTAEQEKLEFEKQMNEFEAKDDVHENVNEA